MVFLDKIRQRLPIDGQGLGFSSDPGLRGLRRWAAGRFWKRIPAAVRPLFVVLARLAWVGAVPGRAIRIGRQEALSVRETARLIGHCAWSGAQPNEAFIWKNVFKGYHPLPGAAAGRLLPLLCDPDQLRLLRDKQAAAEFLDRAGLAVPALLALIPRGTRDGASQILGCAGNRVFVKPRHGSAGRGTMSLEVRAAGRFSLGSGATIGSEALNKILCRLASRDDLLVQARLTSAPDLADLVTNERPPILRLTTARAPGAVPFFHSALLSVDVPGENPGRFISGQLRVPVDPASGRLAKGLWFRRPGERYARLPWSGALLADRLLPAFDSAARMALEAMTLLPELPIVNWDMVLTPTGPVFLEGNTSGDWILTNLAASQGLACVPLTPILEAWRIKGPSTRSMA